MWRTLVSSPNAHFLFFGQQLYTFIYISICPTAHLCAFPLSCLVQKCPFDLTCLTGVNFRNCLQRSTLALPPRLGAVRLWGWGRCFNPAATIGEPFWQCSHSRTRAKSWTEKQQVILASLGFLQQDIPELLGFSAAEAKLFSSSLRLFGLDFLSLKSERDFVYLETATKNPFTISLVDEKQA